MILSRSDIAIISLLEYIFFKSTLLYPSGEYFGRSLAFIGDVIWIYL